MAFINKQQGAKLAKIFEGLHETWWTSIYQFKDKKQTILSENPRFVHQFRDQVNNDNIKVTQEVIEIQGRIYYFKENKDVVTPEDGNNLKIENASQKIRLKVYPEAYERLKDSLRFNIDGVIYDIDSGWRPRSLFQEKSYYEIILKRSV